MPVRKVISPSGKVGYIWGTQGKTYYGTGAKERAAAQGRAAYASGYRGATSGSKKRK